MEQIQHHRDQPPPNRRGRAIPGRPGAHRVVIVVLAAALLATLTATMLLPDAAATRPRWEPPDRTITRVWGNQPDGFRIRHYDGSMTYTPTKSEALAECGAHHRRRRRVRCRAEVTTWYADLAGLRRSLRWARVYG